VSPSVRILPTLRRTSDPSRASGRSVGRNFCSLQRVAGSVEPPTEITNCHEAKNKGCGNCNRTVPFSPADASSFATSATATRRTKSCGGEVRSLALALAATVWGGSEKLSKQPSFLNRPRVELLHLQLVVISSAPGWEISWNRNEGPSCVGSIAALRAAVKAAQTWFMPPSTASSMPEM
jgi:hypothetical protein